MFPTTPPPPRRLLIFARVPELGNVKTRLAGSIGTERALAVYQAMLHDSLQSIGGSSPGTEVEVLWSPSASAGGERLRSAFGDRSLAMQTGATLGERMAMAFSERFFFQRTQRIIAIGVDDPLLRREMIDEAFLLLDSCEWVLGPASDGGYYLIGSRGATFNPAIFRDVAWGGDAVLQTTLDRIRQWQQTVAMLPRRYDIDVLEDLQRFASDARGAAGELPRLLREWGMAA